MSRENAYDLANHWGHMHILHRIFGTYDSDIDVGNQMDVFESALKAGCLGKDGKEDVWSGDVPSLDRGVTMLMLASRKYVPININTVGVTVGAELTTLTQLVTLFVWMSGPAICHLLIGA